VVGTVATGRGAFRPGRDTPEPSSPESRSQEGSKDPDDDEEEEEENEQVVGLALSSVLMIY